MTNIKLTIREWSDANLDNYEIKAEAVSACAEALGIKKKSVYTHFSKHGTWDLKGEIPKKPKKGPALKGRNLIDFKSKYDKNTYIPAKIEAGLKDLGNHWEYENEFVQRSGVSYMDLNTFRGAFSDYFVLLKKDGKKIWCGTKEIAIKIRELL